MTRAASGFSAWAGRGMILLLVVMIATFPESEQAHRRSGAADPAAFRGLGIWVDIFDERSFRNPARAVREMQQNGVETLYLQTGNYSRDADLYDPAAAGEFIDAANEAGIRVVAWYLPGFRDIDEDFRRVMAAIRFRSPQGHAFDAFGLDIEGTLVTPASLRSERLMRLSKRIRNAAGASYPLAAIIPSPVGLERSTYWPDFPYADVAGIFDVLVVMGYYTYHGNGPALVREDSAENVRILRERISPSPKPIHLIGGLAGKSSEGETRAFVGEAADLDLLGASFYDFGTTDAADWAALQELTQN